MIVQVPKASNGGEVFQSLLASVVWCCFSMGMVFSNKAILSVYNFKFPMTLMFAQNASALMIVSAAKALEVVQYEDFSWETAKKCGVLNVIFVISLLSGSWSLKLLTIPMITIFKNVSVLGTTYGEHYFLGKPVTRGVMISIALMILGSILGGITDLSYNALGYMWMAVFVVSSACFVLYMKISMNDARLSEFGMTFYNNLLSLPLIFFMILVSERPSWSQLTEPRPTGFWVVLFLSCILGFFLSLCSFWLVRVTSPTTYSIVGALKKIAQTLISFLLFSQTTNFGNSMSIVIGLSGGVVYSYTKLLQQQEKNRLGVV